jgi:alkylation response protein AidB-like acyl-CoA dehydrogenase
MPPFVWVLPAALEDATQYRQTKVFQPEHVPIAHNPTIQRHIAEMAIPLDVARLLL